LKRIIAFEHYLHFISRVLSPPSAFFPGLERNSPLKKFLPSKMASALPHFSFLQYWATMSYSTCNHYRIRHTDLKTLKERIAQHAKLAGVTLGPEGIVATFQDFIRNMPKQKYRPRTTVANDAPPQKRPRIASENGDVPVPMAVQVPMVCAPSVTKADVALVAMAATVSMVCAPPATKADVAPERPVQNDEKMIDFVLKLADGSDFIVPVRHDGYVNVTKICQAAGNGKCIKEWKKLESSKESMEYEYAANVNLGKVIGGIPPITLLISIQGNCPGRGTFAHPDLAIIIAAWANIPFQFQVSRWVRKLRVENAQISAQLEDLKGIVAQVPVAATVPMVCAPPVSKAEMAPVPFVQNGEETIDFALKLHNGSDFVVPVRRDGYVNVTKICQAAGKRLDHWRELESSKESMEYLQKTLDDEYAANVNLGKVIPGITGITLLISIRGNCPGRGTFAHPDLAIIIAAWASIPFQFQVSRWVRELMTSGRVELSKELSTQQLDDVWQRRVDEERQRAQTILLEKAELEQRLITIEDAQRTQVARVATKAREDLETTIGALVNDTTSTLFNYKNGDNVLYLARIEATKFKYGHTKNVTQRIDAHERPGVYPAFDIVKIIACDNGVASEERLRLYVKKMKLSADYGTQREIISLGGVDDLGRFIKKMNRCAQLSGKTIDRGNVEVRRIDADVETKRLDANVIIETKRLDANVETKRLDANVEAKRLDADVETKRMQMLVDKIITFEQYLQFNKI